MRIAPILATLAAAAAIPAAAQLVPSPFQPPERLDRHGALEALAVTNPEHHRRAVEIIRVAQAMPCGLRLRSLMAAYDARDVRCSPVLILTSYPAKRDLFFSIDETPYALRVSLVADAELSPARR